MKRSSLCVRTDEVDDEAAVAVPAGGRAEEGPAVGRRRGPEEGRQPARVRVGVAEVEHGREVAVAGRARRDLQQEQHEGEQPGGGGAKVATRRHSRISNPQHARSRPRML